MKELYKPIEKYTSIRRREERDSKFIESITTNEAIRIALHCMSPESKNAVIWNSNHTVCATVAEIWESLLDLED